MTVLSFWYHIVFYSFIDSKENVLSLPWIFVGIGVFLAVCLLVWFIYRSKLYFINFFSCFGMAMHTLYQHAACTYWHNYPNYNPSETYPFYQLITNYMFNYILAVWVANILLSRNKQMVGLHVSYEMNLTFNIFYIGLTIHRGFPIWFFKLLS